MPVNSTHADYLENIEAWQRIRDVLAGDRAIKRAGEKYVARLDSQSDDEFRAYIERGSFYNATSRTVSGYVGMIFRRDPVLQLPDKSAGLHPALKTFIHDVDLHSTTLDSYAKNLIADVVSLGRGGTLVDWDGEKERRAYLSAYAAESILNWRQTRVGGQLKLSLVVLMESAPGQPKDDDPFIVAEVPQIRVLKLVPTEGSFTYQVDLWQLAPGKGRKKETEWRLVSTVTPLRLGKPLADIPFIFHGPAHSRPEVSKSPIEDLVAANMDHYRLNTDFRHGVHFTALPTAFVTGFDKNAQLRIGSTTAWVTDTLGATASYLEFKGDGLATFERTLDRVERLLAVLGSRLLESQKRVSESAEALAIRQAGESSIIAGISASVTASLNDVLRWVYWWHSTEAAPGDVTAEHISYQLNSDFEATMMSATEITALVAAWQTGAISRDTLLHNFRTGEILPPARTNDQEMELIKNEPPPPNVMPMLQPAGHDDRASE
jgi:hypothetical protein